MRRLQWLLPLFFVLFLVACGNNTGDTTLDDVEQDSISLVQNTIDNLYQDTSNVGLLVTSDPTSQRATWLSILKSCYASDALSKGLVNTSLLYLGPSSNMYLGTVVDKKFSNNRFDVKTELKYLIPAADFAKFATIGESVNNCDLTKVNSKELSLDLFLSGVISQGMADSLGAKLARWDTLTVTSGKWQIDYIRESDFRRYLNANTSNPDIAFYKDVVFKNRNKIVTKVVKVSGFSAVASYKDTLSAGIQASLSNPVTLKVVNNTDEASKPDSLTGKITFVKASSRKVNISSSNSFYIFANIKKGKKL